mgnify:CR=1 FL=1
MLSDLEIKRLLLTGGLKIEPFDSRRLGPVSYDILTELQDWDKNMARLRSVETFTLPRNILGICSLRSRATHMEETFASFSNLIDPGYSGKLIFLVYSPADYAFNYTDLFQIMFMVVDGKVGVAYNERKSSTAMNRNGF